MTTKARTNSNASLTSLGGTAVSGRGAVPAVAPGAATGRRESYGYAVARSRFRSYSSGSCCSNLSLPTVPDLRIVILGCASVGKTNLLRSFLEHHRRNTRSRSSSSSSSSVSAGGVTSGDSMQRAGDAIDPNALIATAKDEEGALLELFNTLLLVHILDTDRVMEESRDFRREVLELGDAFVLVFDTENAESFREVSRLRSDIRRTNGAAPVLVVANKSGDGNASVAGKRVAVDFAKCKDTVTNHWNHAFTDASANTEQALEGFYSGFLSLVQHYRLIPHHSTSHRRLSATATTPNARSRSTQRRNSRMLSSFADQQTKRSEAEINCTIL